MLILSKAYVFTLVTLTKMHLIFSLPLLFLLEKCILKALRATAHLIRDLKEVKLQTTELQDP